ncbi:hypothetical protein Cpin_5358 [Chitinophaga pinensis DSM 2588]|uniref:Uncharacterized protein n=1 Tax=Chitinophaga pinensis (strain ATCC 43595 / DSM 2588 / LMG 13176 / NBRC 15968 / NCIMB 11800 / UQM 2034) TaxID=485918 RepID=A0A979G8D1_CHIPD|nr:hypothetical protein Cpin_5358 [Chitinophaga pinensis DSM 2588]
MNDNGWVEHISPGDGMKNDYAEESRDMVRPTGMRKTPPLN